MAQGIARIIGIGLLVAYPFVIYLGVARYDTRHVAVVMLVFAAALVLSRLAGLRQLSPSASPTVLGHRTLRARLRDAFGPLVPTILCAAGAAIFNSQTVLLAVPVIVNLGLLATFVASMRPHATPMIERFARLQDPRLSDERVPYCRSVTKVWVGFFAINATISAGLAVAAPVQWWALWCGAIAYLCIGLLFAIEWLVRQRRFGRSESGS